MELALGNSIIEFVGDEHDRVIEVATIKGPYSADLAILSAGNRPNTEWLRGAVELLPDGRMKTDEYMRTSDPDIFAIGDAITVWYNPGKMRMNVSSGTNARRQAHYAVKRYSPNLCNSSRSSLVLTRSRYPDPLSSSGSQYPRRGSARYHRELALIRTFKNDTTTIAIATPTIPTHVMDDRDTRSTMTPPIAAPAAIDNCIIDWFRRSIIPE